MIDLTTAIRAVTIYSDRARVTRSGKAAFEPGSHQVKVAELPLTLNPDSARAAARGAARARLLGLQVQRTYYAETPAEQVRQLEAQLEAIQDEITAVDAHIALARQSRVRMDALADQARVYARALAKGELSADAQMTLLDRFSQRAAQLDTEGQELAIRKRGLERRQQQLKGQLDQVRSQRPREGYTALIDLEVLQAGELQIELSYIVSQAGWQPLYDLRLSEDGERPSLEVGYLAQVTQRSGEAWDDVALTLSTARPALAEKLPELQPWYIAPRPPAPPPVAPAPMRAAMQAMQVDAKAMTLGAGVEPPVMAQAEEVVARVETTSAAVSYAIPGAVSIPPDGAAHKVTVARFGLPPELDYVAAPKLVQAAYRRAKAINDSPYTLLPGAANLFAAEEFIGTTALEMVAPQGAIELYLGVDDRLKIERELKRREVDKALIGGKRRIHFGYEIRLENLLPATARVTLQDQMPVSRHEELKVRLESAEPKPTMQSELNLLEWEMALSPKEKRTVRFDFVVEYPQGMDVFV
jgi:uncharacterized protein (TIGR02231 family)